MTATDPSAPAARPARPARPLRRLCSAPTAHGPCHLTHAHPGTCLALPPAVVRTYHPEEYRP